MKRWAPRLAIVYFVAMAVAVTFPGLAPFNSIRPFIFGVPFVFAWVLSWVVGSLIVFFILYRVYVR